MASSIKISDLTEIGVGALDDNSIVPVVDGGTTQKLPISKLKTFIAESFATDSELSAQIVIVNNTINALDTSDISENGNLYYTNARVDERLNAYVIISGSSQISDLGFITTTVDISDLNQFTESFYSVNIVSSSAQITELLPDGVVSGSSQIVLANADTTGFTTLDVEEGAGIGGLYYTDARVKTKLDVEGVVSGSVIVEIPQGTVSGSQQITDFGFISESVGEANPLIVDILSQSYNDGFRIVSQSSGNVSNLILGGVYVDVNGVGPITFTQFSESVDNRISLAGGGGTSYTFTGDTSPGNVSLIESVGVVTAYAIGGIVSGSQQITDFGFISSSDGITYITASSDVLLTLADNTGFDTTFVDEDVGLTRLYYTDARVKTKLDAEGVVSGSMTGSVLTTENSTVVSGSEQIDYEFIDNNLEFYSGSDAVLISSGSTTYGDGTKKQWVQIGVSGVGGAGDGYVSNVTFAGSTLSFTGVLNGFNGGVDLSSGDLVDLNALYSSMVPLNTWTGSGGGFDIASQSINNRIDSVEALTVNPQGTVSGSEQIDYPTIPNIPTFAGADGIRLSSWTSENGTTNYIISSSFNRDWDTLLGVPSGIISGSGQLDEFGYFATTGSNTFTDNQFISADLVIQNGGVFTGNNIIISGSHQMTGSLKVTGSIEADEFIVGSSGTPSITSANDLEISASADINITAQNMVVSASMDTNQPFTPGRFSDSETGSLSVPDGSILFNTTKQKLQIQLSGVWSDLH